MGVSFNIPKGKTVGLVGESGSGKSVTALSLMRLLPEPPAEVTGSIMLNSNLDILKRPEKKMRELRGNRLSMIFQEPMSSLNPVFTVGNQIMESLILHRGMHHKQAYEEALSLLKQVEVDPDRIKSYPHQLSGGQRQRVMIAMAIACRPDLLIADEPTTALDVTIQKQIMELLGDLKEKYNMSILFITHDLGLIAEIADEILVMWKGRIVESGSVLNIFKNPTHPYTKGLMACRPTLNKKSRRLAVMSDYMDKDGKERTPDKITQEKDKPIKKLSSKETLLTVRNLKKYFPLKKNFFWQNLILCSGSGWGVFYRSKRGNFGLGGGIRLWQNNFRPGHFTVVSGERW